MVDQQEFVKQFTINQQRIFGFVVSISPSWVEAGEIFQRVSLVLWKKWSDFDHDREFLSWALGVSRLEVVKFMDEKRRRKEVFNEEVLDMLQARAAEKPEEADDRMSALQDCIKKLPEKSRVLVLQCYSGTQKIKDIAIATDTTSQNLYSRLQRIRKILHECTDRAIAVKELTQ